MKPVLSYVAPVVTSEVTQSHLAWSYGAQNQSYVA